MAATATAAAAATAAAKECEYEERYAEEATNVTAGCATCYRCAFGRHALRSSAIREQRRVEAHGWGGRE